MVRSFKGNSNNDISGKPFVGVFINGQRWSKSYVSSGRWRENWKKDGDRDEKSRVRVIYRICDRGLDGVLSKTAAAQRSAISCRAGSTVAVYTDVEMFNKTIYSSLSRFYAPFSVFPDPFRSLPWRWRISDLPSTTGTTSARKRLHVQKQWRWLGWTVVQCNHQICLIKAFLSKTEWDLAVCPADGHCGTNTHIRPIRIPRESWLSLLNAQWSAPTKAEKQT